MAAKLSVRTQGPLGRWVDDQFEGIMRLVSGAPDEAPQRTHRWNNHHLHEWQVAHLDPTWMVSHPGDPSARKLPPVPVLAGALAHLTRCGGWQHYLVLAPDGGELRWHHIGWRWEGGAGVSRIKSKGPVRVLIGPRPTEWFGIRGETNVQIPITIIGEGYIGQGGEFANLPLL